MQVAYATEMTATEQIFQAVEGDPSSFAVDPGTRMPVEQTYCHQVLGRRLPNVIGDALARAAALPITEASSSASSSRGGHA